MNARASPIRFMLALLASLLLHALVISAARWEAAAPPEPARPFEARLGPAPPPGARPVPAGVPAAKPGPRRAAQRPASPVPTTVAQSPLVLPVEPEPEIEPVPDAALLAQESPPPPQQIALAPESVSAVPVHSLPRRGRITYTLLYGDDRSPVGKAVQSWEAEAGSYMLASDAETTGIIDLFRPQRLRYLSQGRITAQGLRPDAFLMSRTRRGQTEAAQARFDWSGGSLVYGHAHEQKSAALPAGTQDLMSFIYQLALVPPEPGRFRLPITNGSRFETYEIEVFQEERIETPLGTVRALPVRQIPQAGSESVEIWLAAEYRYLPVKVRYLDREGNLAGEQVVSEIRISEE